MMRTTAAINGLAYAACLATLVLGSGVARADVHAAPQPAPPAGATVPGTLPEPSAAKLAAVSSVDRHAAQLAELSDRIWAYAEIALREHKSAAALADFAEKQGFKVQRGVAGMPTAFVATYGQGSPRWSRVPAATAAGTTCSARAASARPSPSRSRSPQASSKVR
jgi:hypothetical protein